MKVRIFGLAALAAALMLTASAHAAAPAVAAPAGGVAASTPEATFDGMKKAAAKKDWAGFASGLSSGSQDLMIGAFSMMSMPGIPGSDKLKGVSEVMTKHGVKPISLNDIVAVGGDQGKVMDLISKSGENVKDKSACIGDVMGWMEKNADKDSPIKTEFKADEIAASTISDVKIDGNKATAMIKSKKDKPDEVDFQKIDGKWYMDMAAKLHKK
ncbi:MAG TPA: hypothetical protein VFE24_17425 [Pirellulales bacterium]|nr:hypothetical protein [Pirellulales bacterium]